MVWLCGHIEPQRDSVWAFIVTFPVRLAPFAEACWPADKKYWPKQQGMNAEPVLPNEDAFYEGDAP
jgi:hypothetical protein